MVALVELWANDEEGLSTINIHLKKPSASSQSVLQQLLNLQNNNQETPLHQACLLGRHPLVKLLLTKACLAEGGSRSLLFCGEHAIVHAGSIWEASVLACKADGADEPITMGNHGLYPEHIMHSCTTSHLSYIFIMRAFDNACALALWHMY